MGAEAAVDAEAPRPTAATARTRVVILGAAGRDFHDFNLVFRDDPRFEVVAFTAAQIPNIEHRVYPPELAGALYPHGIPIEPEAELAQLIRRLRVEQVVFAYSDVSHEEVMHKASLAVAEGADFLLLGARRTMLRSRRPVISVCAVRTGCGKSPVARHVARLLGTAGLRVGIVRHPMPYGELREQAAQRFERIEDLQRAHCSLEEMEEYEPHLRAGRVVYAGVDYGRILRLAEEQADVLLWDGGNNDLPFFHSDCEIVLADPHRAGHERRFYPGEANLLRADVVVLTKVDTAPAAAVAALRTSVGAVNPRATLVEGGFPAQVDAGASIRGARVLVVEDGPTLTHGGMAYGAGVLAARRLGAAQLVDPRPYAMGSLRDAFVAFPHIGPVLPALGYGAGQIAELERTIAAIPCDVVLVATPVDLGRVIRIRQATCRLTYEYGDIGSPTLQEAIEPFLAKVRGGST